MFLSFEFYLEIKGDYNTVLYFIKCLIPYTKSPFLWN